VYSLAAKLPFLRAYLLGSIPYHVGSVWGNRLGLQVLRTASQFAQFKFRERETTDDVNESARTLDDDGIAVIENFLNPLQFENVKAEFELAFEGVPLRPYKGSENARLYRGQIPISVIPFAATNISEHFRTNDRLNRIASAAVRRKVTRPPEVHLDMYQCVDPAAADNDIENILHADLHTATVKMFFYLDDVDEANGAFVYAKGSHRLTFKRLAHEYELSIRQAKLKKGERPDPSLTEVRGGEIRNVIHPLFRQLMDIRETQISVRPNTLVVANNMGFHRRGEFTSARPRKSIQINYRYLEEPLGRRFWRRSEK
jgi:hypothetical protein